MEFQYRVFETPLGWCGIVASRHGLRRVELPQSSRASVERNIRRAHAGAVEQRNLMPACVQALQRYFTGKPVSFDVPLDWNGGSHFEKDVWKACQQIRYGRTMTYKELAERVGRPGAARAIGTAMSHNPCPIVVPCHRVLRSDGSLGGYSGPGGIRFKQRLLELEEATATAHV